MRIIIRALTGLALTVALSLPAAAEQVSIRLSAYLPPVSHTITNIIGPWAEDIEQESNGDVTFETYWGGTLGRNPYKQYDLVKAGVSEIALIQPGYSPGQSKQIQVLELPFFTRTASEASLLAWRLYERDLIKGFEDVKVLGFWTAEPNNFYSSAPVRSFEDARGLKIRAAGRLEGDFVKRLGAVPETMFPADAVEALRRGTIDAVFQGWAAVYTFQMYRFVSHVITAPLAPVSFALLMNQDTWNRLPAEAQAAINKHSGLALARRGGTAYDRRVEEVEKILRERGDLEFVEPDQEEFQRLREFIEPVAEDWMERTPGGRETYDAAREILEELRQPERQL